MSKTSKRIRLVINVLFVLAMLHTAIFPSGVSKIQIVVMSVLLIINTLLSYFGNDLKRISEKLEES